MIDDHIKHAFTAQTNITWPNFREEVLSYLNRPGSEVRIVFRISGEGGAWADLASEGDWASAIAWLVGKVQSARTRAAAMEIKDMVSHMAWNEDID